MFLEVLIFILIFSKLGKTLKIMLKKLPVQPQLEMFKTVLTSFIHPEHELCLLAKKIDWKSLEEEFAP